MKVITLLDQLEWSRSCLKKMQDTRRPQEEVDLQESVCWTLEARIQEKAAVAGVL